MIPNAEMTPAGLQGTPGTASTPPRRNVIERLIDGSEWIAAFFVGIVALNTFTAVFMRKFFAITIPDFYNIGLFLLGILILFSLIGTWLPLRTIGRARCCRI